MEQKKVYRFVGGRRVAYRTRVLTTLADESFPRIMLLLLVGEWCAFLRKSLILLLSRVSCSNVRGSVCVKAIAATLFKRHGYSGT